MSWGLTSGYGNGTTSATGLTAPNTAVTNYNFTLPELGELFVGLLRSDSVFQRASTLLQHNHFNAAREAHYALLWDVLVSVRRQFGRPTRGMLTTELWRVLNNEPHRLHPQMQVDLLSEDEYGIVWSAFTRPSERINVPYCLELLKRFLYERELVTPLRALMATSTPEQPPAGLNTFLDNLQQKRQRLDGMGVLPMVTSVPNIDSIIAPSSEYRRTGLPWIDNLLGGVRIGDVVGLLGPTGGGKSTTAAHIAVSTAKTEYQQAHEANRTPGMVVFITYEESAQKMWPRIWSAGMQINRNKLEKLTNPGGNLTYRDVLTGRDNMEEYEIKMQAHGEALCEQERWMENAPQINRTLKILDMSGSNEFPNAGNGYVPEVVACLDALQQQEQQPCYMVLTDYAGLMCERYIANMNMRDDVIRRMLSQFGDLCRTQIAEKFACTVVAVHQMAGAKGAGSPTILLHHTHAEESKAFAKNMAACGCLGVPDPLTGCRQLNWSKVRYQNQQLISPVTLRINDLFAIMEDASTQFAADRNLGRFISRDEVNRIQGQSAATRRAGPANDVERLVADSENGAH